MGGISMSVLSLHLHFIGIEQTKAAVHNERYVLFVSDFVFPGIEPMTFAPNTTLYQLSYSGTYLI